MGGVGHALVEDPDPRCRGCRATFSPRRPHAVYCGACRAAGIPRREYQRAYRDRRARAPAAPDPTPAPVPAGERPLVDGRTRYAEDVACQIIVNAHPDGLTLAEVGRAMGFSRERARQIEEKALEKLARRCELTGITREDVLAMLTRRERE